MVEPPKPKCGMTLSVSGSTLEWRCVIRPHGALLDACTIRKGVALQMNGTVGSCDP